MGKEMCLLIVILPLATLLQPFLGQAVANKDGISAEEQEEILDKHNEIRKKVEPTASNMLKMLWFEIAANKAKKWADQCKEEISPPEERKVDGVQCGENVYIGNQAISWSEVIEEWNKEAVNFEFGTGPLHGMNESDVYTQLIWYNSYKVGCGFAYCPNLLLPYNHVCHYCPAGNIVKQLKEPYRSGPSCEDCPEDCEDRLCTNPCLYVDKIKECDVLLKMGKCSDELLEANCQATCNCKTEIK